MATKAPVVLIRLRLVGFLQVRFTNIEEREKAWRGERAEALAQLEKEREVVESLFIIAMLHRGGSCRAVC